MTRAIRRLYSQYRTERNFGWYASPPKWRAMLRELYPVEWVALHHQSGGPNPTTDMFSDHSKRFNAFQERVKALG